MNDPSILYATYGVFLDTSDNINNQCLKMPPVKFVFLYSISFLSYINHGGRALYLEFL